MFLIREECSINIRVKRDGEKPDEQKKKDATKAHRKETINEIPKHP